MSDNSSGIPKAAFGISGLDDVLAGGLQRDHIFLLEGSPGTGKTTMALQFLLTGAEAGETGLYITLCETEGELRQGAASHGWTLGDSIVVFEPVPPENLLDPDQQQSLLYSSDLELGETTRMIFEAVERIKPTRIVLDSLSEIRLLAQGSSIPSFHVTAKVSVNARDCCSISAKRSMRGLSLCSGMLGIRS
jgi:circadian clock protein KaiC